MKSLQDKFLMLNESKIDYTCISGVSNSGQTLGTNTEVVILSTDSKKTARIFGYNGKLSDCAYGWGVDSDPHGSRIRFIQCGRQWFPSRFESNLIKTSIRYTGFPVCFPSESLSSDALVWWHVFYELGVEETGIIKQIRSSIQARLGTSLRPKDWDKKWHDRFTR